MSLFANLIKSLYELSDDHQKLVALENYFSLANDPDKLWLLALSNGFKIKQVASLKQMKEWAMDVEGLPEWLFDESNKFTADLAETISHILPRPIRKEEIPLPTIIKTIKALEGESKEQVKASLLELWEVQDEWERYITIKLTTGRFKVPVRPFLILKALSKAIEIDIDLLTLRLDQKWSPLTQNFIEIIENRAKDEEEFKPVSFCEIEEIKRTSDNLGNPAEFYAEYLWDGIWVQIIHKNGRTEIWNTEAELLTDHFPELIQECQANFILEGQIVAHNKGKPINGNELSKRIQTKRPGKKLLTKLPVMIFVKDILFLDEKQMSKFVLTERKELLNSVIESLNFENFRIDPQIEFSTWENLSQFHSNCRKKNSIGILLRPKNSTRYKNTTLDKWRQWPAKPYTLKAVLLYAHKPLGNRLSGYTDYSFGVWKGNELIIFAKASEGLNANEISEISAFIKDHTIERFGPVRVVKPQLVFELSFANVFKSTRHKSGIGVVGCRILNWRKDCQPEEANHLSELFDLLVSNE